MATLAKAETAANLPAVAMKLRRVVEVGMEKFMVVYDLLNVSSYHIAQMASSNYVLQQVHIKVHEIL
jgi:hypothetical protein